LFVFSCLLFGLMFRPEDERSPFLSNVCELPDYVHHLPHKISVYSQPQVQQRLQSSVFTSVITIKQTWRKSGIRRKKHMWGMRNTDRRLSLEPVVIRELRELA
jgi:hypothetical protein